MFISSYPCKTIRYKIIVCKNRRETLEIRSNKKGIKYNQYYSKRLVADFVTEIPSHNSVVINIY